MRKVAMSVFCLLFLVSTFAGAGWAQKLTREKAAEMISKRYPQLVKKSFTRFNGDVISAFERQAWVSGVVLHQTQHGIPYADPTYRLTETGNKYLSLSETDAMSLIYRVEFKIAEKVFVQVTGIKLTNGGNSAVAEYTWKYHNTTQMYQLIKDTKSAILNWGNLRDEIEKGTLKTEAVRFSLYDDGWRIAQ